MRIGVPKEVKIREYRVGLTPASVRELVARGHDVIVQTDAGDPIGLTDEQYRTAGAEIVARPRRFSRAPHDRKGQRAAARRARDVAARPDPIRISASRARPGAGPGAGGLGAICIAYETITGEGGGLPLLAPMSEVAGRMAVQAGAHFLEIAQGGRGMLLGGVPGVKPGHVAVLGAGVVGTNALQMAVGMGARVTVLDKNLDRLRQLDLVFGNRITTAFSNAQSIEDAVFDADLVIGGVLIPVQPRPSSSHGNTSRA
ncbi:protein of unknown function (plasmid) [Caballeronia sp. S22]